MRHWFGLFACVALGGCVAVPPPADTRVEMGVPYRLSSIQVAAVHNGVKAGLKDPFSAVFGRLAASKTSAGLIHVCGIVNSKNSFGGYVGDTAYYGLLIEGANGRRVFSLMGLAENNNQVMVITTMCRETGVIQ